MPSSLAALPEVVLREVLSWSPDSATANALLSTCPATHQLRSDPSAAALLLLRCRCQDYAVALSSMAQCQGGGGAVQQQVLQLLHACADSGGPCVAPAPLLQAMLSSASASGNAAAIRALLALPQPPDINAGGGQALFLAVVQAPHLAALQALLDSGADPCAHPDFGLFAIAAEAAADLPALQLLLHHCPPGALASSTAMALSCAISRGNLPTVAALLPAVAGAAEAPGRPNYVRDAARMGHAPILQLLLSHLPTSPEALSNALCSAAYPGHTACAELLLERGANVNHIGHHGGPMWWALRWFVHLARAEGPPPAAEAVAAQAEMPARLTLVRLFMERGVVVTPDVRAVAVATKCGQLLGVMGLAA